MNDLPSQPSRDPRRSHSAGSFRDPARTEPTRTEPARTEPASADPAAPHGQPFDPHDPKAPTLRPGDLSRGGPVGLLPHYRVVFHGDERMLPSHAVRALVELTPLDVPQAKAAVLAASTRGHAPLLTTHRERAELYQEQLAARGLTVTVMPGV